MRVIKEMITVYLCGVCWKDFDDENLAKACENRPLEKQKFFKGDVVKLVKPQHCCSNKGPKINEAVIEEILPPECPDEEYERKHLGNDPKRLKMHVRVYQAGWHCSRCGSHVSGRFYTPELKLISRKEKNKKRKGGRR
jgi:DNA-directed RNA polymerase subunit RPC12/RpoP